MLHKITHRNDPQSSIIAAQHMEDSGKRSSHKMLVKSVIIAHPGCTAGEIADLCELSAVEVRRRITDLKYDKAVWPGDIRVCSIEGTKQQTYHSSNEARQGKML